MTKARVVVVPKSQQASVGNIYEADIEFSCSDVRPFIVIVEGDTLDYKNGVPYYKTIREHKGNIIKKGVLLTYNVGRGDYVDFPFEFENKDDFSSIRITFCSGFSFVLANEKGYFLKKDLLMTILKSLDLINFLNFYHLLTLVPLPLQHFHKDR